MSQKTWLQLLLAWMKAKMRLIILLLLILFVEWLVPYLYGMPLYATRYSHFLVLVIAGAAGTADYLRFVRKYHQLLDCYENLEVSLEKMPAANELIEKSYQQMMCCLHEKKKAVSLAVEKQLTDMKDYYTLWAHQIKTPIAAMRLLLEDCQLSKEERYQLENELFRIEQYVEMVMQYMRLESISSDMVLKEYPLYELVKKSVKKYAKSFITKRISLELAPFEGRVITDEKWLSFVIEQLLSNSLKYTKPGGRVSICYEEQPDKKLMIRDNGIGINKEDLPRIFERGFTGFNGRMDKRSTGIGLYLCKKIIDKLAHRLQAASDIGKGTAMTIIFLEEES